jgi:hypothetical protein
VGQNNAKQQNLNHLNRLDLHNPRRRRRRLCLLIPHSRHLLQADRPSHRLLHLLHLPNYRNHRHRRF